jgi:hypothetical protein
MNKTNRFYFSQEYPHRSLGFHWYVRDVALKIESVAKEVTFEALENGQYFPAPIAYINYEDAQQMMDELWKCGIRPTEGAGTAGSMAAVEKHLEDMRKIVFENFLTNA